MTQEGRALRQLEREREQAAHAATARREELVEALRRGESGEKEQEAHEAADAEARNGWEPRLEAANLRVRDAERELRST